MPADTTVPVSDAVWKELTMRKDRGDTFDDVLRDLLELDDDEPVPEPADDVDALISQWEPADEVHTAHARAALRDAVTWLNAHGEPASKSEIVAGARGDAPLSERSWWERAVQPGLRWLSEQGVVEYRSGHHDYAVCR